MIAERTNDGCTRRVSVGRGGRVEHVVRVLERNARAGVEASVRGGADDPVAADARERLGERLGHARVLARHHDRPVAAGRDAMQEVAHADRERDDIRARLGRRPARPGAVQERMLRGGLGIAAPPLMRRP